METPSRTCRLGFFPCPSSKKVGRKSTLETSASEVVPASISPGHFTIKGKGGEGEEGEEHSAIYHLIAAAQKKADLQREGDGLEDDVLTKEREVIALTKTLQELKERNTRHRLSFKKKKVDKKSENNGASAAPNKSHVSLQELPDNVRKMKDKKAGKATKSGASKGPGGGAPDIGLSLTATGISMSY